MRDLCVRLGVLLILIGFGSVILHAFTNYQFRYLMWADGMEPYIGFGIIAVGIALLFAPRLFARPDDPTDPFDAPTRIDRVEPHIRYDRYDQDPPNLHDPPTQPIPRPTHPTRRHPPRR